MRKFFLFFVFVLICLIVLGAITWTNRENILSHFLTRQLHVPVSVKALNLAKTSAEISKVWVGNFPNSQISTSFSAENTLIRANWNEFFSSPLIIEEIDVNHIFVGIEYYDKAKGDSNWSRILNVEPNKKKNPKDYLIRTLTLRDLTVEVTNADGTRKRYPTIGEIQFHNIGSDSGFPVDEIEKAIFNLMMQELIKKLNLPQLFLDKLSPIKLKLPFFSEN